MYVPSISLLTSHIDSQPTLKSLLLLSHFPQLCLPVLDLHEQANSDFSVYRYPLSICSKLASPNLFGLLLPSRCGTPTWPVLDRRPFSPSTGAITHYQTCPTPIMWIKTLVVIEQEFLLTYSTFYAWPFACLVGARARHQRTNHGAPSFQAPRCVRWYILVYHDIYRVSETFLS